MEFKEEWRIILWGEIITEQVGLLVGREGKEEEDES